MNKYIHFIILITLVVILFPLTTVNALTISPPIIELTAEPGETTRGTITLFNETNQLLDLIIQTASFTQTEDRALTEILPDSTDLALWIKVADPMIELQSGEEKYIDFEVSVPRQPDKAGNYAVIFFTQPVDAKGVGIASRIGALVLLTIPSLADKEDIEIIEFGIERIQTPFRGVGVLKTCLKAVGIPPIDFFARIKNVSNTHLSPAGVIEIKNLLIKTTKTLELNQQAEFKPSLGELDEEFKLSLGGSEQDKTSNTPLKGVRNLKGVRSGRILPSITRRFIAHWPDLSADNIGFWQKLTNEFKTIKFGRYQAVLKIQASADNEVKTAQFKFWIFPWRIIGLLIIIGLLGWGIWGIIKKRKFY